MKSVKSCCCEFIFRIIETRVIIPAAVKNKINSSTVCYTRYHARMKIYVMKNEERENTGRYIILQKPRACYRKIKKNEKTIGAINPFGY